MRTRIALLTCGVLLIIGLVCLVCERNRYNMVSDQEIVTIRKKLELLNSKEKEDFSYFINQAIFFDHFSYTLVGCKPMSMSAVIVEDTEDLCPNFRETFKRPNIQRLRRGFLVWEKYQSLFPRQTYVLVDYPFFGSGRREILLIYPQLCKSVIQENVSDFHEILGKSYTIEDLFWILTHPEHVDFYKMIDRTRLFGILLGFGRNNAYLYEYCQAGDSRSILKNPQSEQDCLQMFSNEWPIPGVHLLPGFACDPTSDETKKLQKHYKNARKIVRWTYFLRNKLEVTLALLMRN